MINEKIYFDKSDRRVFLETYAVAEPNVAPRDAILIIPGGGYLMVSWREGVYPALDFLGRGVNAFVLRYSTGEHAVYPRQLLDAGRALAYIKENASRYNINPERIFALGYSAGGHLLGTLTTLHSVAERELGYPEDYLKIRGAIFCYPVVTAYGNTHKVSFEYLLRKPFDEMTGAERELLSIERNITPDTPPAFIWHTSEDTLVPIHGSLVLAEAYYDAGVPVELHTYPYGPHGTCLANEASYSANPAYIQPRADGWVSDAILWMRGLDG